MCTAAPYTVGPDLLIRNQKETLVSLPMKIGKVNCFVDSLECELQVIESFIL